MVGACATYGIDEKQTDDFSWKTTSKALLKRKKTKLAWIFERYSYMYWVQLF